MVLYDGIRHNELPDDAKGLQSYLNAVWQSRPLFLSEYGGEEGQSNTEQKFFSFGTDFIQPKNYVGFVQYNGQRINVYPRVFYKHPDVPAEAVSSVAVNHVLKWLRYSSRIHFPFAQLPLQLTPQEDWLEALIYLFANYTLEALSKAPHVAYQEVTEEMGFVRGRIAMQPYINNNLVRGRHHLVTCTHEPFLYDNLFNRIVKHTCWLLLAVSANADNRRTLLDLLFLLDEVTDVSCTAEDCAKVPVNRLFPEIDTIRNMSAAFLSNRVYSGSEGWGQNLCILLPMEVIFEQYVAGFIQKHFPDLKAQPQASGEYVAKTGEGFTKNVFQMRHDILLPGKLIIDTKYKFRNNTDEWKGGVSQGDMYQMVTYCYKRHLPNGLLLYPYHFDEEAGNDEHRFKIESRFGNLMICAASIDITQKEFGNFEQGQKKKFQQLLAKMDKEL